MVASYMKWAAMLLATAQLGAAQTYTDCDPLNKTCPADAGLNKWSYNVDFTSGSSAFDRWTTTAGTVNSTDLGALFQIAEEGDAPTIESDFYIFFGHVDVKLRAANGTGIVSTWIMESDDLDEIDWEQVSTYTGEIETDYFGKDNTTGWDRATTVNVTDPETTFHTYSIDWTEKRINWLLDGSIVRTLTYDDALSGKDYPQTPMRIRIGIWAGGDPDNGEGTIEWAGGETDYDDGPFNMYVESIKIINYNPAKHYKYTDKTGDYTSIKAYNGTSSNSTSTNSTSTNSTSTKSTSSSSSSSSNLSSSSSGSASSAASASASAYAYSGASASMVSSVFAASIVAIIAGVFQL